MVSPEPIKSVDQDLFDVNKLVVRLFERIFEKSRDLNLVGIFARWGTGKTSVLNICPDIVPIGITQERIKKVYWLEPSFEAWQLENAGSLIMSLLWHIKKHTKAEKYKDISKHIHSIATAISFVGLDIAGKFLGLESMGKDIRDGLKSGDNKGRDKGINSLVLNHFNTCDQISEITETLDKLGKVLCDLNSCNMIMVRIDDIDRCRPEIAIDFIFSLKHLLLTKHFCYIIPLDKEAIIRYLVLKYNNSFDLKDANWFFEKIFQDWITLPPPNLSSLINKLELPSKFNYLREKFEKDPLVIEITSIFDNPRKFIRGCQRFEKFLSDKNRQDGLDMDSDKLLCCLGWFLIYTSNPEEMQFLFALRGFLKKEDEFTNLIVLCLLCQGILKLHDKKSPYFSSKHVINDFIERNGIKKKEDIISLFPEQFQQHTRNPNSKIMKFLKIIGSRLFPEQISECLLVILSYL